MSEETDPTIMERAGAAQEVLKELLRLMLVEAEVSMDVDEEHIMLNIESEQSGLLIGKKGQTLDALQFLVARMVGRKHQGPGRILVDTEGYRNRREEQLRQMAHQVAERVREEMVPYAFDPTLNAAERRIVHIELRNEPDLDTESEGQGDDRRLVVFPRS